MIQRLCPQNEMDNAASKYPACRIPPEQFVKFVTQYLAPGLKNGGVKTELWPGTFRENSKHPYAEECMKNEAFRSVTTGLGVQYCQRANIVHLQELYPGLRFMFTESVCNDSKNTAQQAQTRLPQMVDAFTMGCDSFAYWNMMLDENQRSGWGWNQNSLITIDRSAKTIRYNPDYQPMVLVSRAVRPGDVLVESLYTKAEGEAKLRATAAFVRPDKTIIVLAQNLDEKPVTLTIDLGDGKPVPVTLPAQADCAIELASSSR